MIGENIKLKYVESKSKFLAERCILYEGMYDPILFGPTGQISWTTELYITKILESLSNISAKEIVVMGSFVLHQIMIHLGVSPTWKPNDIDIFFLGRDNFRGYVSGDFLAAAYRLTLCNRFM